MTNYLPEGFLLKTEKNVALTATLDGLKKAFAENITLESVANVCDIHHNLLVDFNGIKGVMAREECAIGISEGTVRDIAIISRVNKPICFKIINFDIDEAGNPLVEISRKKAQLECQENYIKKLSIGSVVPAKVTHLDSFGAFVDIGYGIISLLPIDLISVSRISHPKDRFHVGQEIKCIIKSFTEDDKVCLTHRELLGTWEENVKNFQVGETVKGTIRSIEEYGIFVELVPNLAGLAEFTTAAKLGETATVYIKNIIPDKMKIKLVIIDTASEEAKAPLDYYITEGVLSQWNYSPPNAPKVIQTEFSAPNIK